MVQFTLASRTSLDHSEQFPKCSVNMVIVNVNVETSRSEWQRLSLMTHKFGGVGCGCTNRWNVWQTVRESYLRKLAVDYKHEPRNRCVSFTVFAKGCAREILIVASKDKTVSGHLDKCSNERRLGEQEERRSESKRVLYRTVPRGGKPQCIALLYEQFGHWGQDTKLSLTQILKGQDWESGVRWMWLYQTSVTFGESNFLSTFICCSAMPRSAKRTKRLTEKNIPEAGEGRSV